MKPVVLYERSIGNHTQHGDFVMECFSGSGTTLIACERLGRRAYCLEIEPRYCDVSVLRWQLFTGRVATNAESGQPFGDGQQHAKAE